MRLIELFTGPTSLPASLATPLASTSTSDLGLGAPDGTVVGPSPRISCNLARSASNFSALPRSSLVVPFPLSPFRIVFKVSIGFETAFLILLIIFVRLTIPPKPVAVLATPAN